MADLHSLTIGEAVNMIRGKKCSAEELTRACIERIENVDKTLNAVVHRNFEGALEKAKKFDAAKNFDGALAGVPYLNKDVYSEKGMPTTACSNILRNKDYKPAYDATTVRLMNDAGAISLGKTNTDEFTMGASTETSCFGVTRNPWDPTRVAGGSSGGSAAAVGADECMFATGTDTGGSIRQPPGFCNCVGLRPTYGRTSRYGVLSMASSLDTIGPITKNVEDTAIVMSVISGKDPLDGTTADVEVPDYVGKLKKGVKGMTIGLPKEYFVDGMNAEVEAAIRAAAKEFEKMGARIKDISLPFSPYATATYYVICPCEVSSNMARYDGVRFGHGGKGNDGESLVDYYERVRSEGFGPEVKRRIMVGTYALSSGYYDAYYRKAQKVRALIKHDFERAFKDVDLIMSPVSPNPAFTVGAHEGDPVAMYLEDIFLDGQVMAGIPAISIPGGFTTPVKGAPDGLPIGLQLMGPQWGELEVLQASYACEQATEWHKRKPSLVK